MVTVNNGGFPKKDSPPFPAPPASSLRFIGEDRVRIDGGSGAMSEGEFLRDGKGRIRYFRVYGRLHERSRQLH